MNGTTFNQLVVFNTIVQEGSITKAAQSLRWPHRQSVMH
ncbi:hypothetical protein JCM19235_2211 [Vibrio maritimus]|uniref:Uncharacterized protein n=1 Tax=Vibrio maritimus TaxID=990268 RepID=A0A090RW29_9VIBR|nr:hypothetical protein JCM19235_2211 [Vibrio maritimus]